MFSVSYLKNFSLYQQFEIFPLCFPTVNAEFHIYLKFFILTSFWCVLVSSLCMLTSNFWQGHLLNRQSIYIVYSWCLYQELIDSMNVGELLGPLILFHSSIALSLCSVMLFGYDSFVACFIVKYCDVSAFLLFCLCSRFLWLLWLPMSFRNFFSVDMMKVTFEKKWYGIYRWLSVVWWLMFSVKLLGFGVL